MAWYKVTYLSQLGGVLVDTVEAEDRDQAIATSGVPRQIVQSVAIDHFGGIKSALTDKKLPLIEQALVLSALASKVSSGKTFSKAITESINYRSLGITAQQMESCQSPRDFLTRLRFDDTAILLAETGDKSGRLTESLSRASKAITERVNANKEFGKALAQGMMYSCLGLAFMIGIPLWAGSTIREFIEVLRIPLALNELSHVILFLLDLYTGYWPVFLGGFVLFFIFRSKIWNSVRVLPGLSFINERMKIKRALDFVTSYQLLQSSGFPNLQSFKFLLQRSKGHTHFLYEEAIERLTEGRELAEVFNTDEWPPILHQNLMGFDNQSPSGRENVLGNLAEALKTYYIQYSAKISSTASIIGFGMMLFTIIMFAVGFYMPIVNLNSALKAS